MVRVLICKEERVTVDLMYVCSICGFFLSFVVSAKGRYFSYAQMRRIGDKTAFLELFKCLKENDMVRN